MPARMLKAAMIPVCSPMFSDIPIKIPYTTQPSMQSNTGPVFVSPPDPEKILQKHHELIRFRDDLYGTVDEQECVRLLGLASKVTGKPECTSIVEFALNFHEDVAILHQGRLHSVCFCFPSSWVPREKIGWGLDQIHQGVAEGDRLVQASQRIAHALATAGSFRRWVWTVSTSGDLSQHPANRHDYMPVDIDELWFRTETQTTLPLGDGVSSLFFVDVNVYPMTDVVKNPEFAQKIYASVCSMTPAILEYKNLRTVKTVLDNYFR